MNDNTTPAWQLFEAGKEYKRRIGLYETVRRNERFYRGDQWHGSESELPRPIFNIIRRITDHLVCSVVPGDLSIRYTDDKLPFLDSASKRSKVTEGIGILNRNASYRWKRDNMQALAYKALLNAAISGDGVFYCWWDGDMRDGQPFSGDVRTELVDNTDLFVADVNSTDLQKQEYVLLSGRATVSSLRREARENGLSEREALRIVGDGNNDAFAGEPASIELRGSEKATYLIRFFREDGEVVFEKSTRDCLIKRVRTGLKYYPVAYFNWTPAKGCFHGNAPVSDMIANQKYVNTAYAMVMKHMYDTAFSKVIYDKSRIPEWSNEVGEAIAVVGATNVSDAVSTVGVGAMQEGYLELIDMAVTATKELAGATETALGNIDPTNTSAILALKETSRITLEQVTMALASCIEELANVWADMMCAYYTDERLVPYVNEVGTASARAGISALKGCMVRARVEVTETARYSDSAAVGILDKLLDGGYISAAQYVSHLPDGLLADRDSLAETAKNAVTMSSEKNAE